MALYIKIWVDVAYAIKSNDLPILGHHLTWKLSCSLINLDYGITLESKSTFNSSSLSSIIAINLRQKLSE